MIVNKGCDSHMNTYLEAQETDYEFSNAFLGSSKMNIIERLCVSLQCGDDIQIR